MSNMLNNTQIQEGNTPLAQGKKTIADVFLENKKLLNAATFISPVGLEYNSDEYNFPNQNKFFHQEWNKTFLVEKKSMLKIKLVANFVIEYAKECTLLYNDKSGKTPLKYYLATLKNANGKIEKDIEIANNSKTDYKQFQTSLNQSYNGFTVNMTESEFKAFVEKYISPNIASNLTLYKNAGIISDNKFIYENALVEGDKITWADNDGYIQTSENTYIKIAKATHNLPKLAKSVKTGQQVANELMTNIIECWGDNIVLPLLTLGHMVMSIYFEDFVKRYGVPTLLLFGDSGTGKSTLVNVGLSIFGLSKEAMTSGGSTAKSNEYFCANYNGMNVCIDDVKAETLNSGNFIALIKGAYKAIPRTKMLPYGRGVEYINICSPLVYSTNEALPELKEIINRMNVIEIFGKVFKADKFKYHEVNNNGNDNLKELSLILPEILKYSKDDVIKFYEQIFEMLKANVQDTQNRVISNIAYAYTGALMLLNIAGIEVGNLHEMVIKFATTQIKKYESIKNVVDKVLAEIVTLYELEQLEKDKHFRIAKISVENKEYLQVRFKKDVIIHAINKYYGNDRKKHIDENAFMSYAKNHKRFRGSHSTRLGDKKESTNAMWFDVTGLEEYSDFGSIIEPMSAQEFSDNLKYNQM